MQESIEPYSLLKEKKIDYLIAKISTENMRTGLRIAISENRNLTVVEVWTVKFSRSVIPKKKKTKNLAGIYRAAFATLRG